MPIAGLKDEGAGLRFGPYLSVRKLGDGGMGSVYLCIRVDEEFEKHVAIKCVRNKLASQRVLDRFRYERQILARLEHPNIARLLDGGTTGEGYPYLVMEYVSGQVITDYCDGHRLKIRDRLVLFRKVLSAIQYAHQNLIIHRDIKPGNILVAPGGEPKLLDFGIAKLVGPDADHEATATEARMLTPEYSSPEQIMGGMIGTSSDVYSLGLLLYELLTGLRAHQIASTEYVAIQETVCRQEVVIPSQVNRKLVRELSGDLDTIVLKALRKDPTRRYQSAEQFDEDVRRYLEGLPITARKETFGYVASKFFYRHRVGFLAASAVLASLVFGVSGARVQARAAERNMALAERGFNEVRELTQWQFEFQEAARNLPGSARLREMLAARMGGAIERLAKNNRSPADLGDALERLSLLQFSENAAHTDNLAEALASQDRVLAIRRDVFKTETSSQQAILRYARSSTRLGRLKFLAGDWKAARSHLHQSAQLLDSLSLATVRTESARVARAAHFSAIGDLAFRQGDSSALASYESALQTVSELPTGALVADLHLRLGELNPNPVESLVRYQTARDLYRAAAEADRSNAWLRLRLALCESRVADAYLAAADLPRAREGHETAVSILRALTDVDPADSTLKQATISAEYRLASTLEKSGDLDEALAAVRHALAVERSFMDKLSPWPAKAEAAAAYAALGSILDRMNDPAGANDAYRLAAALMLGLSQSNPSDAIATARFATWNAKLEHLP